MSANRKLDITPDEAEKLAKAMKDPEFRNLLFEYAKEYQNNGGTFPEVQQLSTPSKQQASTETSKILVIYFTLVYLIFKTKPKAGFCVRVLTDGPSPVQFFAKYRVTHIA